MNTTSHRTVLDQQELDLLLDAHEQQHRSAQPERHRLELAYLQLAGLSLRGRRLVGATLTDVDLSQADLTEADLSSAHLTRVNLGDAQLERASLSFTSIESSNLRGAQCSGARWDGSRIRQCDLSAAVLRAANLNKCVWEDSTLDHAKLDTVESIRSNFTRCGFTHTTWSQATLQRSAFWACDLRWSNFADAVLRRVSFYQSHVFALRGPVAALYNPSSHDPDFSPNADQSQIRTTDDLAAVLISSRPGPPAPPPLATLDFPKDVSILVFSPALVTEFVPGGDYFEHYIDHADRYTRDGAIVGFAGGSLPKTVRLFLGPPQQPLAVYEETLEFGLVVRGGKVCVVDDTLLAEWDPQVCARGALALPDGTYRLLIGCPNTKPHSQHLQFDIFFIPSGQLPALPKSYVPTWRGLR